MVVNDACLGDPAGDEYGCGPWTSAFPQNPARLDAAGLGAALERHTPILLAAARALVRNEADARDLVQTTLEIATRRSTELRDPTTLRSWLLAIQVREALRLRRRLACSFTSIRPSSTLVLRPDPNPT